MPLGKQRAKVNRVLKRVLQVGLPAIAIVSLIWLMAGFARTDRGQPPASPLSLTSCNLPGGAGPARCGTYEVFEDRSAKTGRKIKLHLVVLSGLEAPAAADPVFVFHGGPGGAATDWVDETRFGFLAGLRKNHDLVFVDQRGTGSSNGLHCDVGDDPEDLQDFFGELFPVEKIRACRQK